MRETAPQHEHAPHLGKPETNSSVFTDLIGRFRGSAALGAVLLTLSGLADAGNGVITIEGQEQAAIARQEAAEAAKRKEAAGAKEEAAKAKMQAAIDQLRKINPQKANMLAAANGLR